MSSSSSEYSDDEILEFRCRVCPNVIVQEKDKEAHKLLHKKPKKNNTPKSKIRSKEKSFRRKQERDSTDGECFVILFEAVEVPARRENTHKLLCDICGKCFPYKWNLEAHVRSHTGERPFNCSTCGKSFTQKANLKRHVSNIHLDQHEKIAKVSKEKANAVTFSEPVNIPTRKRIQNTPQHLCDICGKMFKWRRNLQSHVRIHTGERPFNCSLCENSFKRKEHLDRHLAAVHDNQPPQ